MKVNKCTKMVEFFHTLYFIFDRVICWCILMKKSIFVRSNNKRKNNLIYVGIFVLTKDAHRGGGGGGV